VACYSPIQAYRNPFDHAGPVLFSPPHTNFSTQRNIRLCGLKIPCGRCIGNKSPDFCFLKRTLSGKP
jgi:hypothetical protein